MNGYLQIECLSDTCFSMPMARSASVDTESVQDSLGLPAVSGKTLHGLLRDTYLSAPLALDPENAGHVLLGKPQSMKGEGVLRIGDAYLVDDQGNDLRPWMRYLIHDKLERGSPLPPGALTTAFFKVRTLTAEDRQTGAPKTEALRVIRVIPRGTLLKLPLQTTRPLVEAEETLLSRLTQLTRHMGLVRNRGLGLVRLSISWEENLPQSAPTFSYVSSDTVFFLHYRLLLTAPCLVPDQDLDPNSRLTRSYLPGSAVRGAVAAALAVRGLDAPLLENILASGTVDFLNAYPEVGDERALPTPISWRRIKDASLTDTDSNARPHDALSSLLSSPQGLIVGEADGDEHTADLDDVGNGDVRTEQVQPLQTPYFAVGDRAYVTREIPRRSTNHQRRHRRTGSSGVGGQETVFVYEALEPQQSFRGCIAVRRGEVREKILAVLGEVLQFEPVWIGRSLRSGYGAAPEVRLLPGVKTDVEASVGLRRLEAGECFAVCLTSDALLRHPQSGQHDPWHLHQTLQERFEGFATVTGVLVQAATVRGFNRLWRTELPSLPAAAAGSVARLCATKDCSYAELVLLQAKPVGERTADGYGRFIIRGEEDALVLTREKPVFPLNPCMEQSRSSKTLREAQRRLYTVRLQALMSGLALDVVKRTSLSSLPTVHLLQRLKEPLRRAALQNNWPTEYAQWLSEDSQIVGRLRDRARRAVNNTWLGSGSLGDLLRGAARPTWELPRAVGEAEEQTRYRILPDAEAESIWDEARRRPGLRHHYITVLLSTLIRMKQAQDQPRQI